VTGDEKMADIQQDIDNVKELIEKRNIRK